MNKNANTANDGGADAAAYALECRRLRNALREIQELTDDGEQHKGSGYRISRISTICEVALGSQNTQGLQAGE